jgi:single-strand DNA-binding protein
MPALNRVQLIGRLGRDPETKTTPKGRKVACFSIAVGRRWKGPDGAPNEATDWFNIEAWDSLGEICQKYLTKGRLVLVEGRLKTDRYEEKGEPRYFTKIIAKSMQMLDSAREKEDQDLLPDDEPATEEE